MHARAPNPSHLEVVDPVVEGCDARRRRPTARPRTRPPRARRRAADPDPRRRGVPGPGRRRRDAQPRRRSRLPTGGTLHIIANNQVGFTTDPDDARSTRYSSDLAKGFDIRSSTSTPTTRRRPSSAVRLAIAFRERFDNDVVIDLVGYRRCGHNERDEPAYTQPLMAQRDRAAPDRCGQQLAERLVAEGVVTAEDAAAPGRPRRSRRCKAAHDRLREAIAEPPQGRAAHAAGRLDRRRHRRRRRPAARAERELLAVPDGFTVHPKLVQAARAARRGARRGRHRLGPRRGARVRDRCSSRASPSGSPARTPSAAPSRTATSSSTTPTTGERYTPLQHLADAEASFEVHNSPLSENARARLRVRLHGARARGARALGGAVRRLRQRRAGDHRPVHRRRPRQVGPDLAADAAAAARLRGPGPRALQRAAGALPPARGGGEHARRQPDDAGAVLPPAAPPGARRERRGRWS